jgi:hypothetical protein
MMSATIHRVPKTQPETSLEARLLAERLAALQPGGDVLSYAEMQTMTGLDIQRKRRDLLDTARRIVLREHHKVFAPVTGIGIRCLTSHGVLAVGEQGRGRVMRFAHRTVEKLACARPQELVTEDQYRLLAYVSIFGAVSALTHARTVQRATKMQGGHPAPVDPKYYQHLFA